jgi:transcriptional regulator with XRE-family HTH domain
MATKSATDIDKQVGARIRARRQALQISQTALAETLGLTFQQVQKYENGTNRISTGRLTEIAKTLQVPVSYFFDGLDGTAETSDLLSDPQIAKLLSAFRAIENEVLRQALVDMALAMGGGGATPKDNQSSAGASGAKGARSRKVKASSESARPAGPQGGS